MLDELLEERHACRLFKIERNGELVALANPDQMREKTAAQKGGAIQAIQR